jgi:hypothetical protein
VWNRLAATPKAFHKWALSMKLDRFNIRKIKCPEHLAAYENAIFSFEAAKLPRYAFKVRERGFELVLSVAFLL